MPESQQLSNDKKTRASQPLLCRDACEALRQVVLNTVSARASVILLLMAVAGCERERYGDWPERAIRRSRDAGTSKALFKIRVGDLAGLIDIDGTVVVTPQFDDIDYFAEGLAPARKGRHWGYIDEDGTWVIEPRFASADSFSSNRAYVTLTLGGKVGYIDRQGNIVISPQFSCPGVFIEGIARVGSQTQWSKLKGSFADVGKTCKYWFIDDMGNPVDRPTEAFLRKRLETNKAEKIPVTKFKENGVFGLKDGSGQVILDPQFQYIGPFRRGLAAVTLEGGKMVGYVNTVGKVVWKPTK